jgi:hypothetical protein
MATGSYDLNSCLRLSCKAAGVDIFKHGETSLQ